MSSFVRGMSERIETTSRLFSMSVNVGLFIACKSGLFFGFCYYKGIGHNKFVRTGPSLSGVGGGGIKDTTYFMNITDKTLLALKI